MLDEEGKPIAGAIVERGPNRYTADDWVVKPGPESWRHVAQPHFAKLMVALPGPPSGVPLDSKTERLPDRQQRCPGAVPVPECEARWVCADGGGKGLRSPASAHQGRTGSQTARLSFEAWEKSVQSGDG